MVDEKSLLESKDEMDQALTEIEFSLRDNKNCMTAQNQWLLFLLRAICKALWRLLDREIKRMRTNRFYNS